MRKSTSGFWWEVALALWLGVILVSAHPHEVSMARAEWIPETRTLEVALKLANADLEDVLTKETGKEVRLIPPSEEGERLVEGFIKKRFRITDAADRELTLSWIGYEIEEEAAWLYFEFPSSVDDLAGYKMHNTLFTDEFEDQLNYVNLRRDRRMKTLKFHRKNVVETVPRL